MPTFRYVVINAQGRKIKGEVQGRDRAEVVSFLKKEPLTIVSIHEDKGRQGASLFARKERVKLGDLVVFSRQLAVLVKTGVPLVRGLGIISSQVENRVLRNIVNSLQVNIESGRSLSESLAEYPAAFSSIFVNMVRAGEMGGALDVVLDKLAGYLEEAGKLKAKIKGAMIYPIIVVTMAIGITSFIFIKVIPSFKEMFLGLGITLPLPTRIIIGISDTIGHFFPYIILGIAGLIVSFRFYIRKPSGRAKFDRLCLRLPIFGGIALKVIVARFSRTLSTLIKSGISILNSLEIVSKTVGNLAVENTLNAVRMRVARGEKIGESLRQAEGGDVFSLLVIDMISIGEETGNISPMLDKIADFYQADVDSAVSGLMSLLEPLLIVFLGGVVGMIAFSMFLPILEIVKNLG
ncbi:MAG: type II secretion system F family protein [Candidatus Omnitrophota bacterium]